MRTFGTALLLIVWGGAAGAQFTSGNLVVSVIKSGSAAAPNSTAQRRILREFAPSGTATGQEFRLPTASSGTNFRLTNSRTPNSATEGTISLSSDGRYLLLSGYDAALGTSAVYNTTSANVPRVIGRVEWRLSEANGAINTSTRISSGFNRDTVRGVASVDGTSFYVAGGGTTTTGGIHYVTLGSSGASVPLHTISGDMRGVVVRDGDLYASCGTNSTAGIGTIGTGLPTDNPQPFNLLSGFNDNANSPHDFYFANSETLYVADDRTNNSITPVGGLQKWIYDTDLNQWYKSTTFRIANPVNPNNSVGAYGVTGTRSNSGETVLYVVSTHSQLLKLTDTGNNSAFEELATAPQDEIWRGVELLPASNTGGTTATISGTVTLQGCTNAAVPLTFRFRLGQSATITQTVTPAPNGTFTTQPLPRTSGMLAVRASNTLQEVRTFNLAGGSVQGIQIELPAGDATGDNYVDVADLLAIINHYNQGRDFPLNNLNYLAAADFNRDGFNDVADLLLVINNYNRSGSFLP